MTIPTKKPRPGDPFYEYGIPGNRVFENTVAEILGESNRFWGIRDRFNLTTEIRWCRRHGRFEDFVLYEAEHEQSVIIAPAEDESR